MRALIYVVATIIIITSAFPVHGQYTKTKYPIVLVHGISGFDTIGGLINYFHTVPYNLERSGAKVYTASVSAFHSSEERGAQLAAYISALPESKVNIMAHSQGAPTSRYAAAIIPHKIASITSINGVNYGSKVADVISGILPPDSLFQIGADTIANALGSLINTLSNNNSPQDAVAALASLNTEGAVEFNTALDWKGVNPNYCEDANEDVDIDGYTIKMFSWTGKRSLTNTLDMSDPLLWITAEAFPVWEENDGLVSTCSAKMGKVISTSYHLNHVDAVNHLFGLSAIWTNPVSLYRSQANRLKNKGL